MILGSGSAIGSGRHTLVELEKLGFSIIYDFITPEEETELLKYCQGNSVKKTTSRNSIKRFGSKAPYRGNIVSDKIPEYFNFLLDRLMERNLLTIRPNSVTINEYLKGQEITPHIDSMSSGEVISVLSLLGSAKMVLQKKKEEKHTINLPPRCLTQMRGEIRNVWQHSILPVPAHRYSIVFRLG